MAELNHRIRIARTLAGLTLDDIAEELDVQRSLAVQYEHDLQPSDSSIEKLSALTGMPLTWFREKSVSGILTLRPEWAGITYSHDQIKMKEEALGRDWPLFAETLGIDNILSLKCTFGGVVIAYSPTFCIVIVGSHSVDIISRLSAGLGVTVVDKSCNDVDFLNCWMQPENLYLKNILGYGGEDLAAWAEGIEDGEPGPAVAKYEVTGHILDHLETSATPEFVEGAEHLYAGYIKQILGKKYIPIENVTVKRTTAIVPGAPPDWQFVYRYVNAIDAR